MSAELSIIIATYNSSKTLGKVLRAIKKQTYSSKKYEIIVVDAGSSDQTINLAKRFGAKIIENEKKDPVTGKHLGYVSAKTKYIMYLDHDEVIKNKNSLKLKIQALKDCPSAKSIVGGNYVSPRIYPFINNYINEFGDPFSCYIYGLSKRYKYFESSIRDKFMVNKENTNYIVFDLSENKDIPIFELVAGASVFDAKYLKNKLPMTLKEKNLLPHFFYFLVSKHPKAILMKKDPLLHYSSETLGKYLRKIAWRVRNNIHFQETLGESGFRGREKFSTDTFRIKKYFFIPYTLLIFPCLYDCIILSVSRRDIRYFIHFPLCLITALLILYHYLLKSLGFSLELKKYGS